MKTFDVTFTNGVIVPMVYKSAEYYDVWERKAGKPEVTGVESVGPVTGIADTNAGKAAKGAKYAKGSAKDE